MLSKLDVQVAYGEPSIDQMIPLLMEHNKKKRIEARLQDHKPQSLPRKSRNLVLLHRNLYINYLRNQKRAKQGRYAW